MSIAHSQRLAFGRILGRVLPEVGRARDLPQRIEASIKEEKGAGSRDRRLYRELVYTWLRHRPWLGDCATEEQVRLLATLAAELPATLGFRREFALAALPSGLDRTQLFPSWFLGELPAGSEESLLPALNRRAPLWLRLRYASDFEGVAADFQAEGWSFERSSVLPGALRMAGDVDVTRSQAFERGLFEVQDIGSQLILSIAAPKPGGRWLDACAGAGGKSLQLAALLGSETQIEVHDIRPQSLDELVLRARRAGIPVSRESGPAGQGRAEALATKPAAASSVPAASLRVIRQAAGLYDGILLDVPCSGTGTWRRSPHLKWSTSLEQVQRLSRTQQGLLETYAPLLRVGGRLIYATCSLCRTENEAVIEAFVAKHPEFALVPLALPAGAAATAASTPGLRILPQDWDGDGYYVCVLERRS